MTNAERITALEVRVGIMNDRQEELLSKLDELLVLRAKGMGAFWLASILFGTGIVGAVVTVIGWFK